MTTNMSNEVKWGLVIGAGLLGLYLISSATQAAAGAVNNVNNSLNNLGDDINNGANNAGSALGYLALLGPVGLIFL